MLAKESSSAAAAFDLPEDVLDVLPSDPFEQLDVARKITSIALSTRVSALESESSDLRAKLAEKDDLIADLQSQVESFDASLADALDKLSQSELEKEKLVKENESLTSTVKKLSRDVSKLEIFKKTLMQSLQEDEDSSGPARAGTSQIIAKPTPSVPRPGMSHGFLLASQTSTPRLTPPGSPPSLSASVSPARTSKPGSPRWNAMSFSTSRGMFDERSSIFSSLPPGHHGSISGSESGSYTGRARVDGKEFFRQVRSRLSYEQFSAFLANVKELNSHKQTREETLRKAEEIFGSDNKDLYVIFEGLITRNVH
ncbi:uncharacterized protein At4g15545 isoform X2 [Rhodamnia argentea]|uniref:Uncharacterized protein At4g15545 isoform X2 n=1 Tax=Rhodamnia argentea TaxID=178133 RepID=A0ABM3HHV1_9MYRT|nr:uncharacterized protein At4g15545 isoform X2 [Rhodamnia argentea]